MARWLFTIWVDSCSITCQLESVSNRWILPCLRTRKPLAKMLAGRSILRTVATIVFGPFLIQWLISYASRVTSSEGKAAVDDVIDDCVPKDGVLDSDEVAEGVSGEEVALEGDAVGAG